MNRTNKDYFTFNVHNTAIMVGQTGSGKSELVKAYMRRLERAYTPDEMRYVLFDLKQVEFDTDWEHGAKEEYLYTPIRYGVDEDMAYLEELAILAETRAAEEKPTPLIFIAIEECDMAVAYKGRFKRAVMAINKNAKAANMKLIYYTSSPQPNFTEPDFRDSFDLILCGLLATEFDEKTMGIPGGSVAGEPYSFIVKENAHY
jgi:hypothetical protein